MKHFCRVFIGLCINFVIQKKKVWTHDISLSEPGLRQPLRIDEMLVHTIIMLYNMVKP